jgi:hypothetical protein
VRRRGVGRRVEARRRRAVLAGALGALHRLDVLQQVRQRDAQVVEQRRVGAARA